MKKVFQLRCFSRWNANNNHILRRLQLIWYEEEKEKKKKKKIKVKI